MISTAKHCRHTEDAVIETQSQHMPPKGSSGFAFKKSVRRLQQLAVFVMVSGLLVGCDLFNKDDDNGNDLDAALEDALVNAADNGSVDFFELPASTDFASIPQDPNNPVTAKKVELGQLLFHETGLLTNNKLPQGAQTASCASCHHAAAGFQAGRIQGVGEGGFGFSNDGAGRINNPDYPIDSLDVQPIRTPSAMNGAYQIVNLWNGQFGATGPNVGTEAQWTAGTPKEANTFGYEGLESQAIGGMVAHRMDKVDESLIVSDPTYTQLFAEAFPGQPIDRERAGLAIAAYERTILANQAPFQLWLKGNKNAMTEQEKRGAILFMEKAACVDCHTGPALTSMTFYALGMNNLDGPGVYGDHSAADANLGRASFTLRAEDEYKFKTPQIYNLTDSPFLGHGGNFRSVREIVEYKNAAIAQNAAVPTSQLATQFTPLGLSADEVTDLVAFIEGALNDPNLDRYQPATLPSGNCLIANDTQSQTDMGC